MNIDIIKNALEYYDKNKEKYESFLKKCIYYRREIYEEENINDIFIFYDKDKKEIYRTEYEVLGLFDTDLMLWSWGWSNPNLDKKSTYLISKILNYGIKLSSGDYFLKSELITSKFKISTKIQLDIHSAIASYLSKKDFILEFAISITPLGKQEEIRELKILNDEDVNEFPKSSIINYIFLMNPPKL